MAHFIFAKGLLIGKVPTAKGMSSTVFNLIKWQQPVHWQTGNWNGIGNHVNRAMCVEPCAGIRVRNFIDACRNII